MFGRRNEEKRSLEDMFTPRDEVELSEEEAVESVEAECEKETVDEVGSDYNNEPIKPLSCFGMEEGKTDKWLMNCVKFWYWCMSFLWFLFGATTFAPIIYICSKVNVIFKNKRKSLLAATIIYVLFVFLASILLFSRKK